MAHLSPFRGASERAQFIAAYDDMIQRWPLPYEDRDVATSFGQTHVIITGSPDAAPLILLHGATATAAMWQPIIGELARIYAVMQSTPSAMQTKAWLPAHSGAR